MSDRYFSHVQHISGDYEVVGLFSKSTICFSSFCTRCSSLGGNKKCKFPLSLIDGGNKK